MLTFPCNAWFDEECKAHLKMLNKLTQDKNQKALTLNQKRRMVRTERQHYQMKETKRTQMFKLQPKLAWRYSRAKRKILLLYEEMEEYVHKLYMHDGIMPMTLGIEIPFNACVSIKDVYRGAKRTSNGNATDATLVTNEL